MKLAIAKILRAEGIATIPTSTDKIPVVQWKNEQAEIKRNKAAERTAIWRAENPERARAAVKKWKDANKERAAALTRRWYFSNKDRSRANAERWYAENSELTIKRAREWVASNPDKRRKIARDWFNNLAPNSSNRIRQRLSSRIRSSLGATRKAAKTEELVGCSISYLRAHIQSLFEDGMSWENAGAWHIDHIVPCRYFDLRNADEQRKCFHFSNLRPLWASENLRKQDKVTVDGVTISARKIKK